MTVNCKSACANVLLSLLPVWGIAVANASPVTWSLSDVAFSSGGTASGSFNYDPITSTYSNIDISTTGGVLPNITYTADLFGTSGALDLTTNGLRELLLVFVSNLPASGGTIALEDFSLEASLSPAGIRLVSGFVTADPLEPSPEPTTITLFCCGCILIAFARMRLSRKRYTWTRDGHSERSNGS